MAVGSNPGCHLSSLRLQGMRVSEAPSLRTTGHLEATATARIAALRATELDRVPGLGEAAARGAPPDSLGGAEEAEPRRARGCRSGAPFSFRSPSSVAGCHLGAPGAPRAGGGPRRRAGRGAGGRPRDPRRGRAAGRRWRRPRSPGRAGLAVGAPGRRPRGRPCHGEVGGRAGRLALEHGRLPARPHRQPLPLAHARLPGARYGGVWGRGTGVCGETRTSPGRCCGTAGGFDPRCPAVRAPRGSRRASPGTPGAHEPRGRLLGPADGDRDRNPGQGPGQSFPAPLEAAALPSHGARPVGAPLSRCPAAPARPRPPRSLCLQPLT
jgi:hypothetical protein